MKSRRTIGSLFAGIGGLELGLEMSGLGPTIWQVEIHPDCREVLERHWPGARRFPDVRDVGKHNLEPPHIICGGFPCQNLSHAGKRAGLHGPQSGLWGQYLRIVQELSPVWVVVENIAGNAKAWVDEVRIDLERSGYDSLPVPLSADDVGAPHRRSRVFLLAARRDFRLSERIRSYVANPYPERELQQEGAVCSERGWAGDGSEPASPGSPEPRMGRGSHGVPSRVDRAWSEGWDSEIPKTTNGRVPRRGDRLSLLGNSVVPQCAQVLGEVIVSLESTSFDSLTTEGDWFQSVMGLD